MDGRWHYKLIVTSKFTKGKLVGGRWRYKLIVSLKFGYKVYNTKMYKLVGGRWRYKLIVSSNFTIQR